ncbi:MAG: ethanolamine ammonia-lyase subunit EutC [Verrucomicrobia bacterium]|nr:ethanolamine ammonia-lyase subunit EutC [Verrucomicrobiota bacterium]
MTEKNPETPAAGAGRDPWSALSRYTSARIALGRTGGSVRTGSLLDFRLAHARARDAVMAAFDVAGLERELIQKGVATHPLATAAGDRRVYLVRPDLGRQLDGESRDRLLAAAGAWGRRDLAIIVSDGLAAQAAERHAAAVIVPLVEQLQSLGWTIFPVFIAPLARVKLQDEIGERLGARHTLMLLGERPGLGSPDSLGAYLTYRPGAARTDAERNCVSNIRPEGLPSAAAARKLAHLLLESARLGVSGIALKDTETAGEIGN